MRRRISHRSIVVPGGRERVILLRLDALSFFSQVKNTRYEGVYFECGKRRCFCHCSRCCWSMFYDCGCVSVSAVNLMLTCIYVVVLAAVTWQQQATTTVTAVCLPRSVALPGIMAPSTGKDIGGSGTTSSRNRS